FGSVTYEQVTGMLVKASKCAIVTKMELVVSVIRMAPSGGAMLIVGGGGLVWASIGQGRRQHQEADRTRVNLQIIGSFGFSFSSRNAERQDASKAQTQFAPRLTSVHANYGTAWFQHTHCQSSSIRNSILPRPLLREFH